MLSVDGGTRFRQAHRVWGDGLCAQGRARDARLSRDRGAGVTLALQGLTVARGSRDVVRDVSLEIPPAEVTTLLGPNGAGKSSLVLAVGGVLRPRTGQVLLDGTDLTRLPPEQIRAS